jgi:RNA polymerase sigma factor (sigma-70 family)
MTAPRDRVGELAAFYASHQQHLERIVARNVRASGTIVEDACQTAWTSLWAHPVVDLHDQPALGWLVTTATREAWKRSGRVTHRETPAGGFLPTPDGVALELPEPAGESPDPCELAIAHAEHAQRVRQLRELTDRERLYLYLQGLGYSYTEMAQSTAASRRTVERQVLRARAKLNAPKGGETPSPRSSEST